MVVVVSEVVGEEEEVVVVVSVSLEVGVVALVVSDELVGEDCASDAG